MEVEKENPKEKLVLGSLSAELFSNLTQHFNNQIDNTVYYFKKTTFNFKRYYSESYKPKKCFVKVGSQCAKIKQFFKKENNSFAIIEKLCRKGDVIQNSSKTQSQIIKLEDLQQIYVIPKDSLEKEFYYCDAYHVE